MIKYFGTIILLYSGLLFAQTTDLEKENIKDFPKAIEESNTKAMIRANLIEGYSQEYHQKTSYNSNGMIKTRTFFNETGDLIYTDTYSYNEKNQIIKIESLSEDESLQFIKDYEYNDNGYSIVKSENDIIIQQTEFVVNEQQLVLSEKETNFIGEEFVTLKSNEYKNNLIVKQTIKFGKDGNYILFKYNDKNFPIEEVIYDLKNKLISKKRRAYDDKNNIIEEYLYDQSGRIKTTNRIKYEYDQNGNWIKRTQYANSIEEPISNTKRTIKY